MTALKVQVLMEMLHDEGVDTYTGVPDSTFREIHRYIDENPDLDYIPSVSEPAAVGLAVGLYLAGRVPMLLTQNSGLGFAINHIASLAIPYEIPLLMLVGWRGWRGRDSPEHEVMGRATLPILDAVGIPYVALDPEHGEEQCRSALIAARGRRGPTAVVIHKEVLSS